MKPIIFRWVRTSDDFFANLVKTNKEYKERVEKSLKDTEDYLEKLATEGKWLEISLTIATDQFFTNGILIDDIGNEDRMFIFVTLNRKSAADIMQSLYYEHYPHIVYVDLLGSMKG